MKIVINRDVGFRLSHKAMLRYAELKGIKLIAYVYEYSNKCWKRYNIYDHGIDCETSHRLDYFINTNTDVIMYAEYDNDKFFTDLNIVRNDPILVQVVEELESRANTDFSELKVVEIPDDVDWYIDEDESGSEIVREKARWWC